MTNPFDDLAKRVAANSRKVVASSFERYNGGAAIKRQYGSSTVTRFYVHFQEDASSPEKWVVITGYGKTPGERKTHAINQFLSTRS